MSTARVSPRWSGVLVPDSGPPVLIRGTVGSVVVAEPQDATPPATVFVVYADDTSLLYSDNTPVEYA